MNHPLKFARTSFEKSCARPANFPRDAYPEVALLGRSNVGKSSLLNCLTQQRGLARTSKLPGRTQLINLFLVDERLRLVDLPGYGFAKVPQEIQKSWQRMISAYLARPNMAGFVWLMDCRHPFLSTDLKLLEYIVPLEKPVHVVLTKADKLSRSATLKTLRDVTGRLQEYPLASTIQTFSSLKKQGVEHLAAQIESWLQN